MERDKHRFYNFLDDLCERSRFELIVVKTLGSRFEPSFIFVLFDLIYIPYICYKNIFNGKELIIIREFNTVPFFFTSILLFPLRNKVILNVNHNFQRCVYSHIHAKLIKLFDRLGYKYLCFEGCDCPVELNNSVLSIPFPMNSISTKDFTNSPLCIGFVGSYRKEKNIESLLFAIEKFTNKYTLVLGTDNSELLQQYHSKGWDVYDTSTNENYEKCLDKLDVLLINYDLQSYFYRHSGVITDLVSKGKLVIIPNYNFFSKQVNTPIQIGVTFNSLDQIENAINFGVDNILPTYTERLKTYYEYREIANLVLLFDQQVSRFFV